MLHVGTVNFKPGLQSVSVSIYLSQRVSLTQQSVRHTSEKRNSRHRHFVAFRCWLIRKQSPKAPHASDEKLRLHIVRAPTQPHATEQNKEKIPMLDETGSTRFAVSKWQKILWLLRSSLRWTWFCGFNKTLSMSVFLKQDTLEDALKITKGRRVEGHPKSACQLSEKFAGFCAHSVMISFLPTVTFIPFFFLFPTANQKSLDLPLDNRNCLLLNYRVYVKTERNGKLVIAEHIDNLLSLRAAFPTQRNLSRQTENLFPSKSNNSTLCVLIALQLLTS